MKIISLKQNFAWTLFGNLFYAATQWGIIVVYAKIGSTTTVGIYSLALAIAAPIFMFTNLQLRGVLATDVKDEFSFDSYFNLRLVSSFVALCLVFVLAISFNYNIATTLTITAIGISKFLESLSDVYYGLLQKHELMKQIAVSMIMRGILSLVAVLVTMWTTGNVVVSVFVMSFFWFVVLICYDFRTSKKVLGVVVSKKSLRKLYFPRKLLWTSLPLGLVMMLGSLNTSIPRFFLERNLGLKEVGIFSAIAYLLVAGTTIVNALGQSATPRLAKLYSFKDKKSLVSLMLKIQSIVFLLGVAGVTIVYYLGKPILTMIYTHEYADYSNMFTIIISSAIFTYSASILGYFVTATRHFIVQIPVSCVISLCTIVVNYILITQYELIGAAYAILVIAMVQLFLFMLISIKIVKNMSISSGVMNA